MPQGWTPLSFTAMSRPSAVPGFTDSRCHAGHQFYKDGVGDWQDVDYALTDQGTYWEMVKASYRLRIAKDFGDPALIQYTNRYEGANHQITYEPHSIWWVNEDNKSQRTNFRNAQSVTGTYDTATQTVTWVNAFGAGVDFEVIVQRSGFKKQIVAKAAPPAGPYTNNWLVPVFKWTASGVKVKPADGSDWDEVTYLEADEFTIEETVNRQLRSQILQAYGVDADGRRKTLRVLFEKRAGALWQGKIIPESLLQQATYPLRADTVTTAFSGAGDGNVEGFIAATTWNAVHDMTPGDSATYTDTTITLAVGGNGSNNNRFIDRVAIPVDTSSIPDTDIVSDGTLNVYVTTTANGDNDGEDFITTVETFQASTSETVVADYQDIGSDNGTAGRAKETPIEEGNATGQRKDIGSISTSTYLVITLDATGIGWIDATGTTMIGLREGHDVLDSAYTLSGGFSENKIIFSSSEETGTSQDPYLEITHAAAAAHYDTRTRPLGVEVGIGRRIRTLA